MKWTIRHTDPSSFPVDVLISFATENEDILLPDVPSFLLSGIRDAAQRESFSGKTGTFLVLTPQRDSMAYKIQVCGIGSATTPSNRYIQDAVAEACIHARSFRPKTIGIIPRKEWCTDLDALHHMQSIVEAVFLSLYSFREYKRKDTEPHAQVEEVMIWVPAGKVALMDKAITSGTMTASATMFARDLVNMPAADMTPLDLAKRAQRIEKEHKKQVQVRVYEKKDIEAFQMGAYLAVAQGSVQEPAFIHMRYQPKHPKKHIVLIGKGITFDTGGVSLKSAEHMETMKLDMAGAAAVLGVFHALPHVSPDITVTGLIAACENMPSGHAMRPGDVVRAMDGTTIEVGNTDAEGRLTLADMICYAKKKEKPDYIVDLATLTGACMIALGTDVSGMWHNNPALAELVTASALTAGEKVWPMPLEMSYKKLLKSEVADIKNIQHGKYGGAITAAVFLSEFIGDTPWVHLDIAGPSFSETSDPLYPKGGTGFGVRLLLRLLISLSQRPV